MSSSSPENRCDDDPRKLVTSPEPGTQMCLCRKESVSKAALGSVPGPVGAPPDICPPSESQHWPLVMIVPSSFGHESTTGLASCLSIFSIPALRLAHSGARHIEGMNEWLVLHSIHPWLQTGGAKPGTPAHCCDHKCSHALSCRLRALCNSRQHGESTIGRAIWGLCGDISASIGCSTAWGGRASSSEDRKKTHWPEISIVFLLNLLFVQNWLIA